MEGPSLLILREEMAPFVGRRIESASGNTKQVDADALAGQRLIRVGSWGKHFLMTIGKGRKRTTLRIHFLMFGSYRINDGKEGRVPRLRLEFPAGFINFYTCAVGELAKPPEDVYDWTVDPMSPQWSELQAIRSVQAKPEAFVCDVLMDQTVFSGVGNIIKNEVLFRLGLHPLTRVAELKPAQRRSLVREARRYCFQFLEWKKEFALRKHWKVFRRRECAECGAKTIKEKTGKLKRVSFYCPNHQRLDGARVGLSSLAAHKHAVAKARRSRSMRKKAA